MDASLTETTGPAQSSPRTSPLLRALKLLGPLIASAIVAWGSVQYARGRDGNRLDQVESAVQKTLSREEFRTWADEQRDRLREIKEDVRSLQSVQQRRRR